MRPTTVLPVCDMMPVRSDHSSQMAANCAAAKQEPRCLQPIYSLCKQWTVLLFRALSLVVLLLLQRPVLFAIAGATPVLFATFVFVHVLHFQCFLQQLHFTLFTCAPRPASELPQKATPTISPLRVYSLFCFAAAAHTNTASN